MQKPVRARTPWAFVPTLYFLQGLPYSIVQTVTTTFFTLMKVDLATLGHWSSLITAPWTLKPLWGPVVDLIGRKRTWIIAMQALVLAGFGGMVLAVSGSQFLLWTTIACGWIAAWSATHDIALDGFYLLALDRPAQALFSGVRSACFRLAMVFITGGIVTFAGWLEAQGYSVQESWQLAMGVAAAVYAACMAWSAFVMPAPDSDGPVRASGGSPFLEALASYFRQEQLPAILAFILLFRVGELMLVKMTSPFLMNPAAEGGMALTAEEFGLIYGTLGIVALVVGGILGGVVIARRGLARCIWPMAITMHAPNLLYLWASLTHPAKLLVGGIVAVEQMAYGFGFAAYTVFLLQLSRGQKFATTHYAISTGLMGLSGMVAGYFSGDIAKAVGFPWFFGIVCLAAIPGLVTLFFVPLAEAPANEPGSVV